MTSKPFREQENLDLLSSKDKVFSSFHQSFPDTRVSSRKANQRINFKMHKEKVRCRYLVATFFRCLHLQLRYSGLTDEHTEAGTFLQNLWSITTKLCGKLPFQSNSSDSNGESKRPQILTLECKHCNNCRSVQHTSGASTNVCMNLRTGCMLLESSPITWTTTPSLRVAWAST